VVYLSPRWSRLYTVKHVCLPQSCQQAGNSPRRSHLILNSEHAVDKTLSSWHQNKSDRWRQPKRSPRTLPKTSKSHSLHPRTRNRNLVSPLPLRTVFQNCRSPSWRLHLRSTFKRWTLYRQRESMPTRSVPLLSSCTRTAQSFKKS
jgi:hypothetical protein